MSRAVLQYLENKALTSSPETQELWGHLHKLYQRRLWHQLTLSLEEFVRHPIFQAGESLLELYNNVIKDVEDRINALSLVSIVLAVVSHMPDKRAAIEFLSPLNNKVAHDHLATTCIKTAIADLHLALGDMQAAEALLAQCAKELDSVDGVTPVHASYYRVSSNFHKLSGNFAAFYMAALQYLACVDIADLSAVQRVDTAFELSLAALLGVGVYNFGELLSHPVLASLQQTDKQWIVELLFAFNAGDIAKFDAMAPIWQAQEDLAANQPFLREKITLLALMETVFKHAATARDLAFTAIAAETQVAVQQVEMLVMKAMSLGLVRGSIDEVAQIASLHWVQPRVLDANQLANMRSRLQGWTASVRETAARMAAVTPELFA